MKAFNHLPELLGVTLVAALICIVPLVRASSTENRTCTSASGTPLYSVGEDGTVRTPSGTVLGKVQNGEVSLPNGEVIAHHGDAGLLYRR